MQISQAGLDLIYSFEGKHRALGDGRYIAYRCPAGVWTIYAGCTKGVQAGMIVTEQGGEAMFRGEIERFEQAVTRLVTVPINQNQRDALISFAFNCGDGALAKSSILSRLNAGDIDGAAKGFALWNKARNGGPDKPLVVMPGLVRRRAAEAALFLKPMPDEIAAAPQMPQAVELPAPKEAHLEAHAVLKEASTGYSLKHKAIKALGNVTTVGGTVTAAVAGAVNSAEQITLTATGLMAQIGATAQLITRYGLPFLGLSLRVAMGIEVLQFYQRKVLTEKAA